MKAAEALERWAPFARRSERVVAGLGVTVFLWIFGSAVGVSAALAAMIGLCILIFLDVLTWDDALEQKGAWDTLLWFAILISMSAE